MGASTGAEGRPLTLPAIAALARAGAVRYGWLQFTAAGLDRRVEDPSALLVKGRLLKGLANGADGERKRALYGDAAEAYHRSAELKPATYPLINAASLFLLAGRQVEAAALASEVLERIAREPDEPETPYYRAATAAEALLILGRSEDARRAFRDAIAVAPEAWEDHATTLRQFRHIHEVQGSDAAWLGKWLPPRSLHYAGHMALRPVARPVIEKEIAEFLEQERIGFGYGALAAGADILIAESLIRRRAELHVILPSDVASFARLSVDPYGREWRARFDAVLSSAATIRTVRPTSECPGPQLIELADEIAMGSALMNADRLASEALQLLVTDGDPGPGGGSVSPLAREKWTARGWRHHTIEAPRDAISPEPILPPRASLKSRRLLAVLALSPGEEETLLEERLEHLWAARPSSPNAIVKYLDGGRILAAFPSAGEAAALALALMERVGRTIPLRVGLHYGIFTVVRDPVSGGKRLAGEGMEILSGVVAATPPGSAVVTEDAAAALYGGRADGVALAFIAEIDDQRGGAPVRLFALDPRG